MNSPISANVCKISRRPLLLIIVASGCFHWTIKHC